MDVVHALLRDLRRQAPHAFNLNNNLVASLEESRRLHSRADTGWGARRDDVTRHERAAARANRKELGNFEHHLMMRACVCVCVCCRRM